ncbi:MAG TPA: aspartyl/glutamyl-tRNA amidotransferase subunit C [Papillibacter sp.]|jgi:aspartyl-tRNA(Asn)/glutamyl-tRNA(Gln) amidotransferase subunit C|nr:aspartyl/glutamyl-tRNA amidotransferase subunit C [Papillibacter sp.]
MITHDELIKLTRLAKLSLDGEDTDALVADITSILEFANTVSEAVVDMPKEEDSNGAYNLREDVVEPSSPIEDILLNAAEKQDTYFVARKKGGTGA